MSFGHLGSLGLGFGRLGGGSSASGPRVFVDGLDTGGTTTSDTTPTILGHFVNPGGSVSGATIHVFVGTVEDGATTTTDGSGNWTHTLAALVSGDYSITATADEATATSTPFNFTVSAAASGIDAMAALLLAA